MTKIVGLRPFTLDIFNYKQTPVDQAELRASIFQNQGSFPHAFISETKSMIPNVFFIPLTQVIHYLPAVKMEKNLSTGKFSHKRP